jgi:hypothetical protein
MLLFLLACTTPEESVSENNRFIPEIPISTCGLTPYSWLDTTTLGTVQSSTQKDELSLPKETLISLLSNYQLPLPDPTYDVETHYIQYTTQDKGQEVLATGMFIFPQERNEETPILLWSHPTMGFNDNCAPTAQGVLGAAYPVVFASMGFVVVAPDLLGMSGWIGSSEELHPYFVAEPTAIVSIDALRALPKFIEQRSMDIVIDPKKLVIWGASEGGYASLFIDRYLPHYAPEFESIATIATIPVTDPFWLAQYGMSSYGNTTAGILGALISMDQWYDSQLDFNTIAQPGITEHIVEELYQNCSDFQIIETDNVNNLYLESFSEAILEDSSDAEPWSCFLKENDLPSTSIPLKTVAPTFIVTAENDQTAIPDPVHRDINILCDQGYQIEHRQCAEIGHVGGALDSMAYQWSWIQDRLEGKPLENICQVQEPLVCLRN